MGTEYFALKDALLESFVYMLQAEPDRASLSDVFLSLKMGFAVCSGSAISRRCKFTCSKLRAYRRRTLGPCEDGPICWEFDCDHLSVTEGLIITLIKKTRGVNIYSLLQYWEMTYVTLAIMLPRSALS